MEYPCPSAQPFCMAPLPKLGSYYDRIEIYYNRIANGVGGTTSQASEIAAVKTAVLSQTEVLAAKLQAGLTIIQNL